MINGGAPVNRTPNKVTPALKKRILELANEGWSTRAISTKLKEEGLTSVSHVRVARLLELEGTAAPKGNQHSGRRTIKDLGRAADATSPQATPGPIAPPSSPPTFDFELPPLGTPYEEVKRVLLDVRSAVAETRAMMKRGEFAANSWGSLAKLQVDLAERLADLEKGMPVRPEDDPANEELRDQLRGEILGRIEDAERLRGDLCPRCMSHG